MGEASVTKRAARVSRRRSLAPPSVRLRIWLPLRDDFRQFEGPLGILEKDKLSGSRQLVEGFKVCDKFSGFRHLQFRIPPYGLVLGPAGLALHRIVIRVRVLLDPGVRDKGALVCRARDCRISWGIRIVCA